MTRTPNQISLTYEASTGSILIYIRNVHILKRIVPRLSSIRIVINGYVESFLLADIQKQVILAFCVEKFAEFVFRFSLDLLFLPISLVLL